ncbi:hypothetical protein VP01_3312g4 [Puccinia sorghi]|uniref:Uncharacterized protein n=1 Tax=Puccinia sorghi TaxID=27349 RepID=A0A0L6UXF3_9BASI|nr:hypothetical protein VP01_3312g4 [Puccinia sorghi]
MSDRHILRLNNCVTIVVWLRRLDPLRFHPSREFSMVIITLPSESGMMAYRVRSQRTGPEREHPGMWRISWEDPSEPAQDLRIQSADFLRRVNAFRQRMWGNQLGCERAGSSSARWLLHLLRHEFRHTFFDHARLRLVIEILVSLLHSD